MVRLLEDDYHPCVEDKMLNLRNIACRMDTSKHFGRAFVGNDYRPSHSSLNFDRKLCKDEPEP